MEKNFKEEQALCIVALLFDSGKFNCSFYGEQAFDYIIKGNELSMNGSKVVVSVGDIFEKEIYDDITPFTIYDELCTIEKNVEKCKDYVFAVMLEDISIITAKKIDKRIKEECNAYLGMTSIDITSTDDRKQFWKKLIRDYSIEGETITCFGYEEAGFTYETKAKKYGFRVNYDGFPDELECENQPAFFSTRQSSFITKLDQLQIKKGRNDSDRGISEMNYSLVKEVEIAGVQIWKAIEDINQVFIPKNSNYIVVDYLFTSWYQAAQGVERLLKILIQLMYYDNNSYNKSKVNELLFGHNHVAMYEFIDKDLQLSYGKNERKFLELLSKFYNEGRYNRFSYSENNILELKILQDFGKNIKEERFDEEVKHLYAKTLGKISHKLYKCISELSSKLNIYVYELNCDSVANYALHDYYRDDLYEILKEIENSKRELLWYILNMGKDINFSEFGEKIEALPFDDMGYQKFLEELVCNINSGSSIYNFVSSEYDEMVAEDKEKWKERLKFIELIGNSNIYLEEESDEESEGI